MSLVLWLMAQGNRIRTFFFKITLCLSPYALSLKPVFYMNHPMVKSQR